MTDTDIAKVSPIISEPTLSPEVRAMLEMGPQLDREPDPAVTGDAIGSSPPGTPGLPPGVDCPVAGVLVNALQTDVAVQASLARIPRQARSVANAVLLWDGRWTEPQRVGGAYTIEVVRAALARGLAEASMECREQLISGPIFLPVSNERETLVLAVGSGTWRWADLLEPPEGGEHVVTPSALR